MGSVRSEMQKIQLNCQRVKEGSCCCHGDVTTETGAGSRMPVPGCQQRGAAAAARKGLSHVVKHHHGSLKRGALVPRVSGAVHPSSPGPVLRTQLLQAMPGEDPNSPELPPRQRPFPLPPVPQSKQG